MSCPPPHSSPTRPRPLSSLSTSPRPPTSTLFPYTTLFRSPSGSQVVITNDTSVFTRASLDAIQHDLLLSVLLVDRKSTRLNSSHRCISYAVFCLKKKKN